MIARTALCGLLLAVVGAVRAGAFAPGRGLLAMQPIAGYGAGLDAEGPALGAVSGAEATEALPYHGQIMAQSKAGFWYSMIFSAAGFMMVMVASFLYSYGRSGTSLAAFLAGLLMCLISALFMLQARKTQRSILEYLEMARNEGRRRESRPLCDSVSGEQSGDALKVQLALHDAGINDAGCSSRAISDPAAAYRRG